MHYNKYLLISVIIAVVIVVAVVAGIHYISGSPSSSQVIQKNNSSSSAASSAYSEMKQILSLSKKVYLTTLEENKSYQLYVHGEFEKMLILNSTVINDTTIMIGNTPYKYVIVGLYDVENNFSFIPSEINVSGIIVKNLPIPPNVTVTGLRPSNYQLEVSGNVYDLAFYSPGFQISGSTVAVYVNNVTSGVYQATIYVSPKVVQFPSEYDWIWLILIKI